MRSYWLKPGTLLEWGNLWHKGVQYRPDAKVLGVFSQIGELYNVHHMWAYKNFQHRKQMRTNAWAKPGWSEKYVKCHQSFFYLSFFFQCRIYSAINS